MHVRARVRWCVRARCGRRGKATGASSRRRILSRESVEPKSQSCWPSPVRSCSTQRGSKHTAGRSRASRSRSRVSHPNKGRFRCPDSGPCIILCRPPFCARPDFQVGVTCGCLPFTTLVSSPLETLTKIDQKPKTCPGEAAGLCMLSPRAQWPRSLPASSSVLSLCLTPKRCATLVSSSLCGFVAAGVAWFEVVRCKGEPIRGWRAYRKHQQESAPDSVVRAADRGALVVA